MLKKMIASFVLVALLTAVSASAGTSDATVSLTATVAEFAEWSSASYTIAAGDWTGSASGTTIDQVGESLTVTKALTLYANKDVTVSAAAGTNSGIATNGTETLTTSYKVTGDVGIPDGAYKAAAAGVGEFFNASNTYSVTHTAGDGSYTINLGVQLESESGRAENAGDYTASITMTATF